MKTLTPNHIDSFLQSVEENKHIIYTEKIGLFDATFTIPITSDLNMKELLIYNNDSILIRYQKNKKEETPKNDPTLLKLNQVVKILFSNKFSKDEKPSDKESSFTKISLSSKKIYFLHKSNLIFVGIYDTQTKGSLIKLCLLHVHTAFINFIGENIEYINKNKKREENGTVSQFGTDVGSNTISKDFLQIKIFEIFCLKSIILHFMNIIKIVFKKEEFYIQNTKFKNLLLIDLSTDEIIVNLRSINNKRHKKFKKNEKIWQEILHHSKVLMKQYRRENGNKYENMNVNYNFVKFECTSTYPRLIFIIKFLPILEGVSVVHVLSQNKLSRKPIDEEIVMSQKYREIDILYGHEFRENHEIDVIYPEPKKLREIEKFLVEFFLSIVNKDNKFYNVSHELKYFDYYLLSIIDEIANKFITTNYDTILKNILIKFYEIYTNATETENVRIVNPNTNNNQINTNTAHYTQNNQNYYISSANAQYFYNYDGNSVSIDRNFLHKDYKESNSDIAMNLNLNTNYMNITREFILKNLFDISQNVLENQSHFLTSGFANLSNINLNNTKLDNTLMLSRLEETQLKMCPNEVEPTININILDISRIDKINEDDNNYTKENLTIPSKIRKMKKIKEINQKNFLTNNSFLGPDSFVKSNLSFLLKKDTYLRPSYSNLDLKKEIEDDVISKHKYHSQTKSENDLPHFNNDQSFGYNSSFEQKKSNYRKIVFNDRPVYSLSYDNENKQEEKPQIRFEIIENLESYEIAKKNNLEVISQPSSENDKNRGKVEFEFNENNEIIREDNKFQYTYPITTKIVKKQFIPTFRGSTEK